MAAWRDGITITTEVAFVSDPLATAPTYTDISADVRGIRIQHGTTSEDGETATPSGCTIQLSNRTRKYDPDHATGPYYGNLMPRKRIRVTAALGAFSAVIFTGWVNGWPQQFDRRFDATVPVTATSSFTMLNSSTLPTSAYAQEVLDDSPRGYWSFQDGYTSTLYGGTDLTQNSAYLSIGSTTTTDATYPVGESNALEMTGVSLTEQVVALGSDSGLTAPAAIEAWFTPDDTVGNLLIFRAALTSTTWIAIGVGNGGGLLANYSNSADNLVLSSATSIISVGDDLGAMTGMHHAAVYRSGTNLVVMIDGSIVATLGLSAGTRTLSAVEAVPGYRLSVQRGTNTSPGAMISHPAVYTTAPSESRFNAHYQVGKWAYTGSHGIYGWEYGGARIGRILDDVSWPSNLRDIDNGVTLCGPYLPAAGNPISAMQDVARAEAGVLLNDTNGKVAFVDRQALWTAAAAATFSDDGAAGAVKYRDPAVDGNSVALIRNVATSTYGGAGTEVTKVDTTSRTSYGASKQADSTPTLVDQTTAANRSSYIVRNKKTPTTRITRLVVPVRPCSPGTTTTITTQITGACRQIGDIVNVEVTPMGVGAQTVKRCVVYGVTHDISDTEWITNMYLSAPPTAATSAPYLVCPSTGTVGAANGRLIPY